MYRSFLVVHTHKPQPLSHAAQDGFSEKASPSSPPKQAPALGSFSWVPGGSKFPVTFFLYFHFQQGEELMIHLLPVTFWITGLRCTRATLRGRAYLLVLSQFGLNIYSLLLGLHAWTPEGSKTFIASPAPVFGVRCSQLSPSPIPSFYITRETRLLAGDAPVLPESLLSSLFYFIKTKRWILTRTHLLTTRGLPSPKWRFDGGRPNKVAHGIFYFSWSRGRLLPLLTFLFLIALQNSFWWSACLYVSL